MIYNAPQGCTAWRKCNGSCTKFIASQYRKKHAVRKEKRRMRRKYLNASYDNRKKINLMKVFIALLLLVILASLLSVRTEFHEDKLMNTHVSVKEAIAELQFTVYENEEWNRFFSDYKEGYLTRAMVFDILEKLGAAKVIPFDEVGKQKPVSRAEWNEVLGQLVDYLDIENQISVQNMLVLECEKGEKEQVLYTDRGTYHTSLPDTFFLSSASYDVYLLGTECVGIVGEATRENTLANTYIIGTTKDSLTFLYDKRIYEKKANLNGQTILEGVADIVFSKKEITAIAQKQDYIEGQLLSYDKNTIEIEGYGRVACDDRIPVYRAYDVVEELAMEDIVLGNEEVKFIVGNQEVCAILLTAPAEISKVRVLLLAEDGGKFRENIFLIGAGEMMITCGDTNNTIQAGSVISVKDYVSSTEQTMVLRPMMEDSLMYICTENGEKISNGYSGSMEIRQYENGYCIVNEVDFETYLYSVVPSEMPSNYQPEALKAQAVCARSYAYIQVVRSDLAAYGAHINDSSSYQVYNNIAKTEASMRAVDETAGMVMLHDGDVMEAYYFSTSMGYTDTAEVWNPMEGTKVEYLKQACLNKESFDGDLSKEEVFKEYLKTDTVGYDSDIKYYRWEIEADYSRLTDEIKNILMSRRNALERHITFYKEDGKTETDSMKKFGEFECFEVAKRSASGCILELLVHFENGSVSVKNEYNIRKVLGCGAEDITFKNGSTADAGSLIPSAFCTVEKQTDGTYYLCGGGYGHGIGMSQNGANGLAKAGYNYIDILNFFYKDIELVDIRS